MAYVVHAGYLISDLLGQEGAELFTAVSHGFCLSCCRTLLRFVAAAAPNLHRRHRVHWRQLGILFLIWKCLWFGDSTTQTRRCTKVLRLLFRRLSFLYRLTLHPEHVLNVSTWCEKVANLNKDAWCYGLLQFRFPVLLYFFFWFLASLQMFIPDCMCRMSSPVLF